LGQDLFGHRQHVAAVAVGHRLQRRAGLPVDRQRASRVLFRPPDQGFEAGVVESFEHEHLRAREQRGIEFERGVFGGCADQHDGAVLDHRQEGVLLRLVETVDLVDEQQRPLPVPFADLRRFEHLAQILHARKNRRQLLEMQLRVRRQNARQRGLTATRRTPEDHRGQAPAVGHLADRRPGSDQVVLADDLVERLRAQTVRQRPVDRRRRAFLECKQIGHLPYLERCAKDTSIRHSGSAYGSLRFHVP
jgi:hypothetical protein